MCYFLKGEKQDYYVNKIMTEMKRIVPIVYRGYEDSQDGEVVVGRYESGKIKFWITFDPTDRLEMDKHIEEGTLLEYILNNSMD